MTQIAYDCYLGDKASLYGYRLGSLVRDSAPQIAPRFSSGEHGESDLDLLKSASLEDLSGGMFQRDHIDKTKVSRSLGFFNPDTKQFYPNLAAATPTGTHFWASIAAKAESESYTFLGGTVRSGGNNYNYIDMLSFSGNITNLVLPAAVTGVAGLIYMSDLCIHKGYLYVAFSTISGTATNVYRYNISANTWQDIGCNGMRKLFTLRNILYGIKNDSTIYVITNEEAAGSATATLVTTAGGKDLQFAASKVVEFNGAAWIAKPDGLYRFDGVAAVCVLTLVTTYLQVFNGNIYFFANSWLYSFDGTNLRKLQYFSDKSHTICLSANSDYLFIQTKSTTATYDSPKTPSSSGYIRLYSYDGAAFNLITEVDQNFYTVYDPRIAYCGGYLYDLATYATVSAYDGSVARRYNVGSLFGTASSTSILEITTSEFDDGFPNIYKSLEFIEVDYSGIIAGDVITVKYQLHNGVTWGSWQTLGTITSISVSNKLEITDYNNKLFKRMKISVTATCAAGSTLTVKRPSWRYTLQPRVRWRWQALFYAIGNSHMTDRTGSNITTQANALANQITQSIKQKTPVFFLTPHYGQVKTTVNAAAVSLDIKGQFPIYTDPYLDYPTIAVLNANSVWEILQVTNVSYNAGTNVTTVTINARGYLGITAASLSAGNQVRICHKVYINRLVRDNMILSENSYQEQSATGESQLEREFLLELVEV